MSATAIEVMQREAGYLRLLLPPALRNPAAGAAIENGLKSLAGVQRVTLLTAAGRLAVRFDPRVVTHAAIALRLKAQLAGLPQAGTEAAAASETEAAAPSSGLVARIDDLRERLVAAAPQSLRPLIEGATTEKAITNFFNDLVLFYLIKVHWDLIVKLWIKNPVKYRNAWLTVFYLVFLLIRYRKS